MGQSEMISGERASPAEAGAEHKGLEVEMCLDGQGWACWNGVGLVQGVNEMRSEGIGALNRGMIV